MTVQETILSFPGLSDFPEAYLETLLAARSLSGADAAGDADKSTLNLIIADTLVFAVNLPDFTENRLSVKYPRDYFISTARMLYANNGEPDKADLLVKKVSVPRGKAINVW